MLSQTAAPIHYPSSDGKPLAENTRQLYWIVTLFTGLAAWFRSREDVFVASDLLWYTVEGDPGEGNRTAPDIFVVFGRPKGHRLCYLQWEEGVSPQVVIEILSPGNTPREMARKFLIYEDNGVEEYYIYDPDNNELEVYTRGRMGAALVRVRFKGSFTSPRLGVRFDMTGTELVVYHPDGRPYLTPEEADEERARMVAQAASAEKQIAAAQKQAAAAARAREDAEARLARIVELGRKARRGEASADEVSELERLESPP